MTPTNALRSALLALLLTIGVQQTAAQELRTSIESLSNTSEAVVVAQAVETESFWNEDRTAILTRVVLRVDDQLQGQAAATTEIIIPGGRVGDTIHEVSDMPHFEVNEEAVVFVERHRSGILVVSGGLHGKLPVTRNVSTGIKMVGGTMELFEVEDTHEHSANDDQLIPLDDFKLRFKELRDRQ